MTINAFQSQNNVDAKPACCVYAAAASPVFAACTVSALQGMTSKSFGNCFWPHEEILRHG